MIPTQTSTSTSTSSHDLERDQKTPVEIDDVLESVDAIIWEAKTNPLRVTYVSPAAKRILGHDLENWEIPDFWQDLIHPADRAWVANARKEAIEHGGSNQLVYRVVDRVGRIRWIQDRTKVTQCRQGKCQVLRGVLVDVTRARQERVALERQEELRRMESIDNLATNISNDFNNLLAGIVSSASLLEYELPEDHPARRLVRDVLGASERATRLVDDLTCRSRTGNLTQSLEPVADRKPEWSNKKVGTVLVVDEQDISRRVTKGILKGRGMSVLTACDSAEALQVFDEFHSCLGAVVVDASVTGIGDSTLVDLIRHLDAEIPILVVSEEPECQEVLSLVGYNALLAKPFGVTELIQSLNSSMERSALAIAG